jgi:hypothetical protein
LPKIAEIEKQNHSPQICADERGWGIFSRKHPFDAFAELSRQGRLWRGEKINGAWRAKIAGEGFFTPASQSRAWLGTPLPAVHN